MCTVCRGVIIGGIVRTHWVLMPVNTVLVRWQELAVAGNEEETEWSERDKKNLRRWTAGGGVPRIPFGPWLPKPFRSNRIIDL